jgi:hypothetical protein
LRSDAQRGSYNPAVDRHALLPQKNGAAWLLLLDLLAGRQVALNGVDVEAFAAVVPPALAPFIHWRLQSAATPPQLRDLFAAHYRHSVMSHLARIAELRRIDATLRAGGIEYLLLKGPVLAATVYADPATRTMIDLDLLVREADLPRAVAALATIGYGVPPEFLGVTLEPGDAPPLVNARPGLPVIELHTLLDSAPDDPSALDAAWASARLVSLGNGIVVPTLGRAEFFAHVVAHASRHHRFEGQLRSLLDIALLLNADDAALDWIDEAEWERRGLGGWIALTLELAHVLLDSPLPDPFAEQHVSAEALVLAAAQLTARKETTVPERVAHLLGAPRPSPVHRHGARHLAPLPSGLAGVRVTMRRQWRRAAKAVTFLTRGTLRPRGVVDYVTLLRDRERLFTLVESERRPR